MFRNNQAEFNQTYWELIETNEWYAAVEICDDIYQIKKQ